MLIGLVITSIIGALLGRLLISQARFYDKQAASHDARAVSRSALNMMLSDLRMVETGGGLTFASDTAIVARVPYALGVVCGTAGGVTTVSILPTDSVAYATAGPTGIAWRDSAGVFSYVTSGVTFSAGTAANCTAASVTTLAGGQLVNVSPALPSGAQTGHPVFLVQDLRYAFRPSTAIPGRRGLYRVVVSTGSTDELVAPLDTAARFRFFALNGATAQAAPPSPLTNLRGLEVTLTGQSELTPGGASAPSRAPFTTAVYFKNRVD